MPTGVRALGSRDLNIQAVHYFRKRVNFNDAGIANGVQIGVLPAGANIIGAVAKVVTAFNAATTNVLTAGTDATTYVNVISAADVTEGAAAGSGLLTTGTGLSFAVETPLFVKYTQTGTAATAGAADIIIMYAPNNDQ